MNSEEGNTEDTQTGASSGRRYSRSRLLFLVLILLVLAFILAYNTRAKAPSPGSTEGSSVKTPNLSVTPASQNVPLSSALAIKIWAETGSQKVNAVQADISYPIDKLNFVNVDSTNSAFGLSVKGSGENGKINISRGSFQPVSGKLLVATINFTGANSTGQAQVKFVNGTVLLSATNNKNILAGTYGGTYSLTK